MTREAPRLLDDVLENRHDSDAMAVVDVATGEQVTYRTLARRAQALTGLLASLGVGRHQTVAMLMDKSIDSVVCMWAALRLGARYVPLDESLPAARVEGMLGTCRPAATVVHPRYLGLAAGGPVGALVTAGGEGAACPGGTRNWDTLAETGYLRLAPSDRHPDDHAYLIFTSGSTGGPKGVMISHRAVCALLAGVQRVVGFEPGIRYLNVAPLFFDASIVDLYSTFAVGGTVHLLPRLTMPTQLTRACEDWRITDTLLVPSVIRMLVGRFSDIGSRDLSSLRRLWFGGEACPVPLLRALDKHVPGLVFVHGYGPTETTHSATLYLTRDLDSHREEYLPIGESLPSVDILLVNEDMETVPDGETGELLIGGPQVMSGYCGDAARTQQVMVRPPGSEAVYYRSGDFARRRGDSQLVFVGRRDDALKINGNLVHLSEVEAGALSVGWVSDCCAVPADHPLTGRAITLFVAARDEEAGEPAGADSGPRLHRELAAMLPGYMLPSRIVLITSGDIALTSTGKLDRDRLRALAGHAHD